ncbi:uncharacterized protein LOC131649622 [Vicia villosa]|uniref:uncharacterized protein LOC131649622 n=1 Tax=Vicia villosa TaxID=3911 RepID=UPI00273BE35F|nr:uncharacterized protein LOC131649622 [Vicia villosa]
MEVPLQICRKNKTTIDTTDVFTTSERFVTREEVICWVKETGINNKVTVIIARSDTETGKRGRSNKVIFGCDKGGKYKDKSETQSATKRCGCPFKIKSTPAKDGSGWKVDVKCGVHNHGLPDRLEGHSFVGRLTTDEKQHVADLTKRHVPPRHILISLQERDPENVTRITQIYKHKSVIEAEIRGPRSEIQHLLKLIEEANYVYWSRKRDDCEVTKSYCWVLDKLKQLFVKKDVVPQVILTDRDLALMKAVEVVFPTSHNLLCRFHINKNVGMKCKEYVMKDMQETIGILVESAHWKLKQMIGNSLGDMVKVWEAMNSNLKIQIGNIRASFQKSFYEVEHAHISPFYDNMCGSVSRAALRRIAEELLRLDYVLNSREVCGCTMSTSYGLPCACDMGRLIVVGIPLQI